MLSDLVRKNLRVRYGEPHRAYHTMAHIEDCLGQLAQVDLNNRDRRILEAAIWFHDAIYDATRNDNEALSADLARVTLAEEGCDEAFTNEVARLILLTVGHHAQSDDFRGRLLVSIDLSILGASPERYDRYAADIRREYSHVPEPLYRAGRASVLKRFLGSEPLLPDPDYAARLDPQARENLQREIAGLEA